MQGCSHHAFGAAGPERRRDERELLQAPRWFRALDGSSERKTSLGRRRDPSFPESWGSCAWWVTSRVQHGFRALLLWSSSSDTSSPGGMEDAKVWQLPWLLPLPDSLGSPSPSSFFQRWCSIHLHRPPGPGGGTDDAPPAPVHSSDLGGTTPSVGFGYALRVGNRWPSPNRDGPRPDARQ